MGYIGRLGHDPSHDATLVGGAATLGVGAGLLATARPTPKMSTFAQHLASKPVLAFAGLGLALGAVAPRIDVEAAEGPDAKRHVQKVISMQGAGALGGAAILGTTYASEHPGLARELSTVGSRASALRPLVVRMNIGAALGAVLASASMIAFGGPKDD